MLSNMVVACMYASVVGVVIVGGGGGGGTVIGMLQLELPKNYVICNNSPLPLG